MFELRKYSRIQQRKQRSVSPRRQIHNKKGNDILVTKCTGSKRKERPMISSAAVPSVR